MYIIFLNAEISISDVTSHLNPHTSNGNQS